MKHRLKWLLVGVGVMYSLQLVILLAIRYLIPHSGPAEFFNLLATMVYTLLAFLGGGFVIGRMAEQLRIIEPTLAAVAALLLDVLSTQAGSFEGIFLFSIALQEGD